MIEYRDALHERDELMSALRGDVLGITVHREISEDVEPFDRFHRLSRNEVLLGGESGYGQDVPVLVDLLLVLGEE
jgi:hypothetical protein